METPKSLGPDESLKLFNSLSHAQQLSVMMARTRLARCQACPQEWPLAHKVGVADLCNGGIQEPIASNLGRARALIAEMEQPAPAYKDRTDLYQHMRASIYLSLHPGTSMGEALRIVNQR